MWFTVAGGVLSDVYYPTIDNTNVETLQYIVTDGSTFTDLQARDMVSTAKTLDDSGMSCRVTSTANSGKYKIVTDYVTDPDRNTLVMRTRLVTSGRQNSRSEAVRALRPDRQRQRWRRHGQRWSGLGGHRHLDTPSDPRRVRHRHGDQRSQPRLRPAGVRRARRTRSPRSPVATPAHASDGLTQLDAGHALTAVNDSADTGNIVQVAEVKRNRDRNDHSGAASTTTTTRSR